MKYKVLLGIFIICFIASLILAIVPVEQACGETNSGCSIVQASGYKDTLGINNSYFGTLAFLSMIILTISHIKRPTKYKKQLLKLGIIFSSIIAIYFIYLQAIVIGAYCKYCMVIDIGSILSLILIYYFRKK